MEEPGVMHVLQAFCHLHEDVPCRLDRHPVFGVFTMHAVAEQITSSRVLRDQENFALMFKLLDQFDYLPTLSALPHRLCLRNVVLNGEPAVALILDHFDGDLNPSQTVLGQNDWVGASFVYELIMLVLGELVLESLREQYPS